MLFKRLCYFIIIFSFFFLITASAQFDQEMDRELLPPVSFKIISCKEPVKAGKESTLKIKFSVLPGYHINVVPAFKIDAKTKDPNIKITATPIFDKKELKKAEKLVAEGKSVYLDTSKEYPFSIVITGVTKVTKLDVAWTTVLYYCSEKDGLCYRKELKINSKLEVSK
jgi:hypothetical protein